MFPRLNKTLLIGYLLGFLILTIGIIFEAGGKSAGVFFHPIAIMIVLGGSVSVALISLPFKELKHVLNRTYWAIAASRNNYMDSVRELIRVSVGLQKDVLYLEREDLRIQNAMFRDALELVKMGFKTEDIRAFLNQKKEQNESSMNECASLYYSIAKMGPAFGLLGTLLALISVLYYHMGSGDMVKVASSMGVALTATLYGVGSSNLVFGPLAEYMQFVAERTALLDELVVQGTLLIKDRKHPIYFIQAMRSYVPREEYQEFDQIAQLELEAMKDAPAESEAA